jgi:hypothetical protein
MIDMSAQTVSLQQGAEDLNRSEVKAPASGWRIAMQVKVKANTRRIFNALIEPEYRELWMLLPGHDQTSRVVASQSKNLFRLDYFRSGSLALIILGAYRVCNRRKILFDWWQTSSKFTSSSVEIRLDSCSGCSVLSLTHSGLIEKREYLWHRQMWEASLAKLERLL